MPLFRREHRDTQPRNICLEEAEITIQVIPAAPNLTVKVQRRVTIDSSPILRSVLLDAIRRAPGPEVVIDLSGVSYLDMSGLATLLEALRAAQRNLVRLRVTGIGGQCRLLAEIGELDKIFQAAGSEVEYQ